MCAQVTDGRRASGSAEGQGAGQHPRGPVGHPPSLLVAGDTEALWLAHARAGHTPVGLAPGPVAWAEAQRPSSWPSGLEPGGAASC